jgi:tellurite resistance protein
MFKDYSEDEKLAVIAVVKGIIAGAKEGIGEEELDYIREHITNRDFPDYNEMFVKFEKKYKTEASIYEAFAEITRDKVKGELIDLALNLAAASGVIEPKELDVINHMCEIWGMEHKVLPDEEK